MSAVQQEIFGWFSEGHRRALDTLIKNNHVRTVLEIGTFLGKSAAWFAARVDTVTCVDLWRMSPSFDAEPTLRTLGLPDDFYAVFQQNMKEAGVEKQIVPIRGNSREVSHLVGMHDLVYIDDDHTYPGCFSSITLYGPKALKVLCGDDFKWGTPGVIAAVNELVPRRKLSGAFWWVEK